MRGKKKTQPPFIAWKNCSEASASARCHLLKVSSHWGLSGTKSTKSWKSTKGHQFCIQVGGNKFHPFCVYS